MELRYYWRIITKRAWIVLLLPAVALVAHLLWSAQPEPGYHSGMRFVVGIEPEPAGDFYSYDRYYTWLTAEYLVDDLAEVVKSHAFAQDVAQTAGLSIPPGAIHAATSSGKLHRVLNVSITWTDPAELGLIANAVAVILTEQADTYFAQLATESAVISLIDPPGIHPIGPSLRDRLDLPLRLLLALGAGIGLAFLLDYLDSTVRNQDDLRTLGLPILGEIPQPSRWRDYVPLRRSSP